MISGSDREDCIRRYDKAFEQYGKSHKALLWGGDAEKQVRRFKGISEHIITNPSINSVLDVGCGFGDFYSYLSSAGFTGSYTGLDLNSNFIKVAKSLFPAGTFICGSLDELMTKKTYDAVISCGIFNYKLRNGCNLKYIENSLNKIFSLCNCLSSCDFLTSIVDWKNTNSFHLDPLDLIQMVTPITNKFRINHHYLEYEYSVTLFK